MQAKGRRHSSLQLIGCSVTTRKRRRGGATKQLMGVCDKSVFTYKRGGGWGGLVSCSQDQVYFQGGKKPCTLKIQEMSRKLNQKTGSDHNGYLAHPTVAVIFGN